MKKLFDSKVAQLALVGFLVIAASIAFYFLLFHLDSIFGAIGKIINIMTPLIIGLVLAYIMNPFVKLFEKNVFKGIKKYNIRRNLSIACSVILILGALAGLMAIVIPQFLYSAQSLVINASSYANNLEKTIMGWVGKNPDLYNMVAPQVDNIKNSIIEFANKTVVPTPESAFSVFSDSVKGAVSGLFNAFIGLVFSIYILANSSKFGAQLRKGLYSLFDINKVNAAIEEIKHVNQVFQSFMIGKICDSFGFVFVCCFLFLLIFRYPYALLIAVIIGITDLIPYFGPYIGSIPSAILIFLISPVKALIFIIFIIVLQQIDSNIVTPRIQTQATGLPSFWVLFSIMLFGGLFKLVGILIAVPCFTIIYELTCDYINSRLRKKNLPEDTNYYYDLDNLEVKKVKAKL